jgi:hypothetical protein
MATTDGADRMREISRELKEFADRRMIREFSRTLSRAADPLRSDLPASARRTLPRRGGLANEVAKAKIRITRKANGSVKVTARQQYQIGRMDDPGVVRHQVFKRRGEEGRRAVWVSQRIQPGWFTNAAERRRPALQDAMLRAADDMAARIEGRRQAGQGGGS